MAAAHTTTKLQALVVTLQDEVTALQAARAASATELQALVATLLAEVTALRATRATSTAVVFADMPQMLGANDLINNLSKLGSEIYKQSIMPLDNKAFTDGFNMTANKTVVFTKVFQNCDTAMGWNQGTKQVITFNNIGKQQKEEQQKKPFKANSATVLWPPRPSTPSSPPSWPPWPTWTKTNDGSRRHT